MYSDLVERNLSSGEQLVTMVAAKSSTVLAVSCEFVGFFLDKRERERENALSSVVCYCVY